MSEQERSKPPSKRMDDAFRGFEGCLANMVEGVARFQVDKDMGAKLVQAETELSNAIDELIEHQHLGDELKKLRKLMDVLDQDIYRVLVGLSDSRRTLQTIGTKKDQSQNVKVSVDELLDYATRITKFTHAPPGYSAENPENANFPWPSEDELRRGNIAVMAANYANGDFDGKGPKDKNGGDSAASVDSDVPHMPGPTSHRRSSLVSYGERPNIESSAGKKVLDLDLFDPDEEYDE